MRPCWWHQVISIDGAFVTRRQATGTAVFLPHRWSNSNLNTGRANAVNRNRFCGYRAGTKRVAQIVHCKRETHLDRNRAVRSRSRDRGTGARDDRRDRAAIIGAALAIRAASFFLPTECLDRRSATEAARPRSAPAPTKDRAAASPFDRGYRVSRLARALTVALQHLARDHRIVDVEGDHQVGIDHLGQRSVSRDFPIIGRWSAIVPLSQGASSGRLALPSL